MTRKSQIFSKTKRSVTPTYTNIDVAGPGYEGIKGLLFIALNRPSKLVIAHVFRKVSEFSF
jgi:hypothetical protein